ncbi:DUF2892 domain-containing protein [soil metagenome]
MSDKIFDYKDRVRENTPETDNQEIDQQIEKSVESYARKSNEEISKRIAELGREWDIERVLESNASILALTGLLLANRNKRWLFLSAVVLAFLLQHAIQGRCPPIPFFRKLKIRTRQEIDKERYALKVLRGDFDKIADISSIDTEDKPGYALDAVK